MEDVIGDMDELLEVKDIQRYLKCGHNKAYKLLQVEGFPKTKVGGKYKIPKNEFKKWFKSYMYSQIDI